MLPIPAARGHDIPKYILALIQTTTCGLFRWICPRMPLGGVIKHGVLLDPVPLHRDHGHT